MGSESSHTFDYLNLIKVSHTNDYKIKYSLNEFGTDLKKHIDQERKRGKLNDVSI
mgnify:CR=1 FL=1